MRSSATGSIMDGFRYEYNGNQLTKLYLDWDDDSDFVTYAYDANGNCTVDGPNNLDLTYNYLNLIGNVSQDNATLANYVYLADGTKVSATNASGDGLVYTGSLVYSKQGNNLSLESTGFSGGRLVATSNDYEVRYFLTDHLGSTRAVVNSAGVVLERNDFMPFGLAWADANRPVSDNRYLYNGKEKQEFVDVPYTDFGARMYDPKYRLSWNGIDPLAWDYTWISPYAYCLNNPVRYIDPDGRTIQVYDFIDNRRITYEWRQYEGNWGFYDSNNVAYAGTNQFIGQLSGALTQLMNGGQAGFDLISGLANHSNVVTLMYSNSSGADHQNQVGWNPTGVRRDGTLEAVPTTAGMSSDPTMTLGHELAHVEYNWNGENSSTWFNIPTATGNRPISTSEVHTTHRENQMRSENGLPLRTHYGVDQYGTGIGPRIIVPSTGTSRYYNSQGSTNYRPLKRGVIPY